MRWSLSEFLNIVDLRSQTWCHVNLGARQGFRLPSSDTIFLYAVLDGEAEVAGLATDAGDLKAGDIVIVVARGPHVVRNHETARAVDLEFLSEGEYADTPPVIAVGDGPSATRILASQLKVRWPGGQHPAYLPPLLRLHADDSLIRFDKLLEKAQGSGAMSLLTRAATLLLVDALRDHPDCRAEFNGFSRCDPIQRAQQYMQVHPFNKWSVEVLAHKVGMGRSNFATRFTREVGRTPMQFLFEERMSHATRFLEQSDMKIAEIGKRVGYDSEATFARRFRAHFGIPPGEVRRRRRAEQERPTPEVVMAAASEWALCGMAGPRPIRDASALAAAL